MYIITVSSFQINHMLIVRCDYRRRSVRRLTHMALIAAPALDDVSLPISRGCHQGVLCGILVIRANSSQCAVLCGPAIKQPTPNRFHKNLTQRMRRFVPSACVERHLVLSGFFLALSCPPRANNGFHCLVSTSLGNMRVWIEAEREIGGDTHSDRDFLTRKCHKLSPSLSSGPNRSDETHCGPDIDLYVQ